MTEQVTPYQGDALGRTDFAKGLLKLIANNNLFDKGVLAIDGEWGVGKTWFGENLLKDIKNQGKFGTAWINTFEADWEDDPALSIIAGISAQIKKEDASVLISKVSPYLINLMPIAAKAVLKIGSNLTGIDPEAIDAVVSAGEKSAEKYLENHIKRLAAKKTDIEAINSILSDSIKEFPGKKLVIFIDELDRCAPDFAIRFLERLKHLFDIDGVIFILLWNRRQIQSTIETFYGKSRDGSTYLDKFLDFSFALPACNNSDSLNARESMVAKLLSSTINDSKSNIHQWSEYIALFSMIFNLTAREIKRIAVWFIISATRSQPLLELWLLSIKVKLPSEFHGIRHNFAESHEKIIQTLNQFKNKLPPKSDPNGNQNEIVEALIELHTCHIKNDFNKCSENLLRYVHRNSKSSPERAIPGALRRLESAFD